MFTISAIVMRLEAQGAYPMLLGRPWLRTTNIKQHWQRNMISFRRGKTKVRIITEERVRTALNTSPLYVEGVHMLDGLADDEVDDFLDDHPTIIPLFEINAIPTIEPPKARKSRRNHCPKMNRIQPQLQSYAMLGMLSNGNSPFHNGLKHQPLK